MVSGRDSNIDPITGVLISVAKQKPIVVYVVYVICFMSLKRSHFFVHKKKQKGDKTNLKKEYNNFNRNISSNHH